LNLFFDTSSLIKKYIEEVGSDSGFDLCMQADEIALSAITRMEFFSALSRLLHTGYIDKESFEIACQEFEEDCKDYTFMQFEKSTENKAIELLKNYHLRTLDSIQLASAKLSNSSKFITSDKKLFEVAVKELKIECVFV
jgi:uncharacterized protein